MKSIVIVLSILLGISTAHVRLTFPPARQYDFDFLDNVRTNGPCGMQSGMVIKTFFKANKDYKAGVVALFNFFNAVWYMPIYPLQPVRGSCHA